MTVREMVVGDLDVGLTGKVFVQNRRLLRVCGEELAVLLQARDRRANIHLQDIINLSPPMLAGARSFGQFRCPATLPNVDSSIPCSIRLFLCSLVESKELGRVGAFAAPAPPAVASFFGFHGAETGRVKPLLRAITAFVRHGDMQSNGSFKVGEKSRDAIVDVGLRRRRGQTGS